MKHTFKAISALMFIIFYAKLLNICRLIVSLWCLSERFIKKEA